MRGGMGSRRIGNGVYGGSRMRGGMGGQWIGNRVHGGSRALDRRQSWQQGMFDMKAKGVFEFRYRDMWHVQAVIVEPGTVHDNVHLHVQNRRIEEIL